MPFPFQVAGFWTGAMRKYEGFGTAYAHKQTESGDPTDGGWINLSEQRWVNSGERHRQFTYLRVEGPKVVNQANAEYPQRQQVEDACAPLAQVKAVDSE